MSDGSPTLRKCPRCDAAIITGTDYDGHVLGGGGLATSRATRDEGAPVMICGRCGEREATRALGGGIIPLSEWPVTLDQLIEEETALLGMERSAKIGTINGETGELEDES